MEKIHYQTNTTFPSENTVFSLAQPRNQLNLGQDTSIFNSTDLQPEPTALKSVEFVDVLLPLRSTFQIEGKRVPIDAAQLLLSMCTLCSPVWKKSSGK